uniref:Uncharacterized protein n=1 Tax=Anguilla anguilla TaxID=7936 RepID=A0A0E9VXE2_ANGAN
MLIIGLSANKLPCSLVHF